MSEEIAVLGPLPAPSTTWLQMGSGAYVLDAPSYVDGVAQSVSILLFPGKSAAGRCYLEVYQRTGDRFTRRQSTPVALDVTVSQLQTVSVKPTPVSRGDYVGLRMEGGALFTQLAVGAPAHMWWDVDPVAGTAGRYEPYLYLRDGAGSDSGAVLSDGLDRAAAEAAIKDLDAQGRRWQLAVRDAPPAP